MANSEPGTTITTARSWWKSRQAVAFGALLGLYALVTAGVIVQSPILRLDTDLFKLDLRHRYPEWKPWVHDAVMFGQRGPATLVFLPVFIWVAWRRRSARPLIMLVTSLLLLNVSVGIVKLGTGRIGPLQTSRVHDVFVGGDIYPSGHVSNAVVLYGLLAMISITHRKLVTIAAIILSVEVGLSTVYLDTHWFSDVLGGWIAGGLVLLGLPWAMPAAERTWERSWLWLRPRLQARMPAPAQAWLHAHLPPPAEPQLGVLLEDPAPVDAPVDTPAPLDTPPKHRDTLRPRTAPPRVTTSTHAAARPARPVPVQAASGTANETPVSSSANAHSRVAT